MEHKTMRYADFGESSTGQRVSAPVGMSAGKAAEIADDVLNGFVHAYTKAEVRAAAEVYATRAKAAAQDWVMGRASEAAGDSLKNIERRLRSAAAGMLDSPAG